MSFRKLADVIVCLASSIVIGCGLAYAQNCYSDGSTLGSQLECNWFHDDECDLYGGGIVCEYYHCKLFNCTEGYSMRCRDRWSTCFGPSPCSSGGCA